MNRVNTIINTVKSHLNQYNFIETDFEIQDNKLIISIYPRYEFTEINDNIDKNLKVIQAELDQDNIKKYRNIPKFENYRIAIVNTDYQINVYNTLNNYINR